MAGFLLLVILIAVAIRDSYRQSCDAGGLSSRRSRVALICSLGALFALLVACKLVLVHAYGGSVPFADQWVGEGTAVYRPFAHGTLRWVDLTAFHNEHRIATTRVWHLGVLLLNGQWDPLVQVSANAFLHACAGLSLCLLLWRQLGHLGLDMVCALVLVTWALPFNWENTLAGFQVAFYFLVLSLVVPMSLMPGASPKQPRWWVGVAFLVLGPFSVASGILNAVAVMVALVLRQAVAEDRRDDLWPGVLACGCVVLLAIAIRPTAAISAPITLTRFAEGLVAWHSWPYLGHHALAWIAWTPLLLLLARCASTRRPLAEVHVTVFALAAWVMLHGVAISYVRGGGDSTATSRYTDVLSLGVIANAVALVALLREWRWHRARSIVLPAMVLWVAFVGLGLARRTQEALDVGAPGRGAMHRAHVENLQRFMATGDLGTLRTLTYPGQIPFPSADVLADVLLDPAMRPWLPPPLRDPLPIIPPTTDGPFAENTVEIGRLAVVAYSLIEHWEALLIVGVLLAWVAARLWTSAG